MKVSQRHKAPPGNLPTPISIFVGRAMANSPEFALTADNGCCGMGAALGSLGWIALLQHDYTSMRAWLSESLAIRTEIGDRGGTAWCLEKLAEAKYEHSQFAEATRIFGQADALRTPIGSVIDPVDQPNYDRLISGLQSALGTDAFASTWAEGASMQLDDVIDLALSEMPLSSAPSEKEKLGGLTAREREVAALIAQGKSNREIAEAMTVGVKTIETYVTRILNKLSFDSRVQIATWAVEKRLLARIYNGEKDL